MIEKRPPAPCSSCWLIFKSHLVAGRGECSGLWCAPHPALQYLCLTSWDHCVCGHRALASALGRQEPRVPLAFLEPPCSLEQVLSPGGPCGWVRPAS